MTATLNFGHFKPHLKLALLLEFLLLLLNQDKASSKYPTEIIKPLCFIISLRYVTTKKDYALPATRVMLKLLESETRFLDFVVIDERELLLYLTVLLTVAYFHQNDEENPDLSRRALGALGTLSTRSGFADNVKISNNDEVFQQIVDLLHGTFAAPKGVSTRSSETPMECSLYTGIACVILGNMAISDDSVQELLQQVPTIIPTAMTYFTIENDAFGLQGAHLIKNITVAANKQHSALVLQRGGASLVERLLSMGEFSHLRLLGSEIANNLLRYTSLLGSMEAALDHGAMVRALTEAYHSESRKEIIHGIVLACDAAVEELLTYDSTDGDEEASAFLEAETLLSKLFIDFLYSVYSSGTEVNILITLKASKSLGVMSTAPALAYRQPDPTKIISILDHTIRRSPQHAEKLAVILEKLSNQLVQAQPQELKKSNYEAVTTTYKGIINNLGYVASRVINGQNSSEELLKASEVAIKNAAAVSIDET